MGSGHTATLVGVPSPHLEGQPDQGGPHSEREDAYEPGEGQKANTRQDGKERATEPDRLYHELFTQTRSGGLGLLRDLQDLYLMASACDIAWTMVGQAAQGARDVELLGVVDPCEGQTATQIKWLRTRMKQAAPQALLVAS